jgi:small subunit ribosomal protein S18
MTSKKNKARLAKESNRRIKKKSNPFSGDKVDFIDYKDINLLQRFMTDRSKIRGRRLSGADQQQQREITNAIKNATEKREMKVNILSYDCEDTVSLNDEELKINWLVKKTNFLTQLKNCFSGSYDTSFNVRRTTTPNEAADSIPVTLFLEFWP